jgi:hypothetical protein
MSKNILKKQLKLKELALQLEALKNEVETFESLHPQITQIIDELSSEKKIIIQKLQSSFFLEIPKFCMLECIWNGINEWPDIKSVKFFLDKDTNNFLFSTLTPFNLLFLLQRFNHGAIKEFKCKLDSLDKQIIEFNNKVKEAKIKYSEEEFDTFLIKNNDIKKY